ADGYSRMALFAAIVMALSIIVSSIGLHHEIEHLPRVPKSTASFAAHFAQFRATVSNKAFLILMAAGVFAYTAQGVSFALSNYLYSYVWRFEGADYQWLSAALLLGAVGSFILAPMLTKGANKPRVGMVLSFVSAILLVSPYILRLLGLFPEPGSPAMLPVLLAIFMINTACSVGAFILGSAMLADVVEESETRTGQRSEGVFFAGGFFVQKMVGGLGIFMAGAVLAFAAFPAAAKPGLVPAATIDRLTIVFVCLELLFYGLAGLCYARFPFGRAEHEERLALSLAAAEREGAPHAP
ncbi:MAG: MFS transporter, partial [Sphingobium limneticum]